MWVMGSGRCDCGYRNQLAVRLRWSCWVQLAKPFPSPLGHDEVALALEQRKGLLASGDGLVLLAGGCEYFGEVAERLALEVEGIGSLDDGNGLKGECFRLGAVASVGENERLCLAPPGLRGDVPLGPE